MYASRLRALAIALWIVGLCAGVVAPARAADAGVEGRADAAASASAAGDASAPSVDAGRATSRALVLQERARQIRALLDGSLAPDVSAAPLFDVALDDEVAVAIQVERLRRLVGAEPRATERREGGASDAGAVDASLWAAQSELDRARLAFLQLPIEKRRALLDAHREAVARMDRATDRARDGAERQAETADAERARALEAARTARSEAERLVAEEEARLLGLEREIAHRNAELDAEEDKLHVRADATLAWQRRARSARQDALPPNEVDSTYDALRTRLRGARDDLARALDAFGAKPTAALSVGADPLADIKVDIDTRNARQIRERVERESSELRQREAGVRSRRAALLLDEVTTLNRERLALLPFLSVEKRDAITGLGEAGRDQARSELRHLVLVLAYHRHALSGWMGSLRQPRERWGASSLALASFVAKWLIAIGVFVWWRRRAPVMLTRVRERLDEQQRRLRGSGARFGVALVAFVQKVRRPLEWIVLARVLFGLVPATARATLELELIEVTVTWTLGGALVVAVTNALASARLRRVASERAELRLRSLRLVGRVVVAFGLLLAITARLVGKGTIYDWVFASCWYASIPVLLVLIRWWRATVFERIARRRSHSAFVEWIVARQRGWRSIFTATLGAGYLMGRGVTRATRRSLASFDPTRRLLAYLFRRRLDRLGQGATRGALQPLPAATFERLSPEAASEVWVAASTDGALRAIDDQVTAIGGGIVAVVAERGMGKSWLLRRAAQQPWRAVFVDGAGVGGRLERAIASALDEAASAPLDALMARLDDAGACAILVDDAERLVRPTMGGLQRFDEAIALARRYSRRCTWVFAFDAVVWTFLERARSAQPLFDRVLHLAPWTEAEVVELLARRTEEAELQPTFERLLDLPLHADDAEREEALEEQATNYYRVVWDYARGNPAIALTMWRRALGIDEDGSIVVSTFQAPDARSLDALPDEAVFVLRALLQLCPAQREAIVRATMLRDAEVADALRYATAHGYAELFAEGYRITWTWLRPVLRLLQHRHLLVES